MLVPVAFLALRACFLADIPADNLDNLHPGLSCSQIPAYSVTHVLAVAVAAAGALCSENQAEHFLPVFVHPSQTFATLLRFVYSAD